MSAITYRTAGPEDAVALAQLGATSFVAKFGALYRAEDLNSFLEATHSAAAVATELARDGVVYQVAEGPGALVGYCKLTLASTLADHAQGRRPAEIKQLYTDPAMTGQGIGAVLLGWALNTARTHGADEMQLSVWSENHAAQRFYSRYGFRRIADIHFWVGEQRDEEYLFALKL